MNYFFNRKDLSNGLSKQLVKQLAEADDSEVVREIHEMYADYIPLAPQLFSVGYQVGDVIDNRSFKQKSLNRIVQAICAVLLSLKCCPVIRYQASSELAKRLADNVRQAISKEASLFDFRQDSAPLLLVIDRREDAVTPLLNQWTYEAMVHELLGIQNKRVDLTKVPGVSKDYEQVVLSIDHDPFYAQNIYKNFGEIGSNIKNLIDEFQKKSHNHAKIESITDMKSFIDNYPQFKKMSGTVGKHVTVVGELSRLVNNHKLLHISECEQQLACEEQTYQRVEQLVSDPGTREIDAVRLVLLYALRYENQSSQISSLTQALTRRGINDKYRRLIHGIVEYGGQKARYADSLFGFTPISGITKKILKGLKGVENIYTQHRPLLHSILENIFKGQLKENQYPFIGTSTSKQKPQQVIVFIVGGATYEESFYINEFNSTSQFGAKAVLGSTYIHNTKR